jgi:tyrosyl-tRNA synthetase
VRTLHGEEAVAGAESAFDAVSRRETPEDLPEIRIPGDSEGGVWVVDLITAAGFAGTNGEARRLIRGGAVRLGGEQIQDEKLSLPYGEIEGMILQVGKRRYARLVG